MESIDSVADDDDVSGPREWCPSLDTRDSPADLPRCCVAGLRLLGECCYTATDSRAIHDHVGDSGNSCRSRGVVRDPPRITSVAECARAVVAPSAVAARRVNTTSVSWRRQSRRHDHRRASHRRH
jgi:hypothetical protein